MDRQTIKDEFDDKQKRFLNELMDGLLGSVIQLTADPTTAGGQLRTNELGFNPTTSKLFANFFGTTYSVTLTAV